MRRHEISDIQPLPMRGHWVRLRTLIFIRWLAIGGQILAIAVGLQWFHLQLEVELCIAAIAVSAFANLGFVALYPQNKRLTESEALWMLQFDLAQLCFLIFVSGGLSNPFALLVLVPVTIAASSLGLRTTLILGASALAMITLIYFDAFEVYLDSGVPLDTDEVFKFGFWMAIVVGILFLGIFSRRVSLETRAMSDALLATQMALAREQKLTDLGGVVAAAAHELGTPLATIKLVSSELMNELKDQPDLYEDAKLIRSQADRCRDILHGMGRAGKDDTHLHRAPLATVLNEAAEPHLGRGKAVLFSLKAKDADAPREPAILRRPEIIHGLRNLIQNAVDFAATTVWVNAQWSSEGIWISITDNGPGYPQHLLGRIGDPFIRLRAKSDDSPVRPGYEGMGLGLFIAKTLLERSGAVLTFSNAADPFLTPRERTERCGAMVEIYWPAAAIFPDETAALAPNLPF